MKKCILLSVLAFCLAVSTAAWSLPLNDFNELINGDFNTGDLSGWQAGEDIAVALDGPGMGYSATCKNPGGDLWLRQIVDDSLSPGWNWDFDQKILDLTAQITWSGWEPPFSSISFRLDWWDPCFNNIEDPTCLPNYEGPPVQSDPSCGYYTTDWVTYTYDNIPAFQWVTVNPFDRILLPVQPRWVSVDIIFDQAAGESVWLDNVVLTGQCVPEPSGMLILLSGGVPLILGRRFIRRK